MTHGEAKFQKEVKQYLESQGARIFVMTSGIYTERGISDLVGTLPGGRAIYVEVKYATSTTAQQRNFLRAMQALGAFTAIVYPEAKRIYKKLYPDDTLYPEGFVEFKGRLRNG